MRMQFRVSGTTPAELRDRAEQTVRSFAGADAVFDVEIGEVTGDGMWDDAPGGGTRKPAPTSFSAHVTAIVPDPPAPRPRP